VLAWYPAYRWHEHYLGVLKEQRNLIGNAKGKGREPEWVSLKYRCSLSGADEVVVVLISSETGKERRASHEWFLFVLQLNEN